MWTKFFTANWKTSAAAILAGLAVIMSGISAAIDNDPSTIMNSSAVMEAIAGVAMIIWGIFSRDAKTSDK